MKNQPPLWKRATDRRWKRVLITVSILVAIPFVAWGVAEFSYQQRINKITTAVNEVARDYIEPAGGTLVYSYVKAPHYLDSFCVDNGPCPIVTKSWLVPVAKGQDTAFIASALKEAGFSGGSIQQGSGGGVKNGVGVSITVQPVEVGRYKAPHPAPSGMEWELVSIDAQEPWKR